MTAEPRPLRAVFLDIGDTVMRPNPSWEAVYAIAFREFGVDVEIGELHAALRRAYHHGGWGIDDAGFEPSEESSFRRTVAIDAAAIAELGLDPMPDAFFRRLGELFMVTSHWHIFPDAYPTLSALRERGLTLGAVSNWVWNLPELLHALDLVRHFDFIAASSRIGFEKPNPRIFEWALEQAKADPGEVIHVGDHLVADIEGARGVGHRRGADRPIRSPRLGGGTRGCPGDHGPRRAPADRRRSARRPMSEALALLRGRPDRRRAADALGAGVAAWRERPDLAGLRWTEPESWHLTLAFLGSVEADAVPADRGRRVEQVAARSGADDPDRRWARRVSVARAGDGGLVWHRGRPMEASTASPATSARPSGSTRPSRSDRTSRSREPGDGPSTSAAFLAARAGPSMTFRTDRIELMRSHLGRGPARYEVIAVRPSSENQPMSDRPVSSDPASSR